MFWSEMHQQAMELAIDIYGAEAMLIDTGPPSGSWPGTLRAGARPGYPVSPMMTAFFFSRSETIWGGTSQIQRNIVAERVLGLPRSRTRSRVVTTESRTHDVDHRQPALLWTPRPDARSRAGSVGTWTG